jgi:SAM-dependent methyltransferase
MGDSYNPEHFEALFEIEDRHFWFGARNRALEAIVVRATRGLAPGYRVLEVGCGTGFTLRMLADVCSGALVVGMDLFGEGLKFARRRTAAPLVQASIERPPFTKRFHVVGLFDVLEHLEDDRDALRRVHGLLEPGGCFIVTVPAEKKLWSRFDEEAHHCRRYGPGELREKLATAGFDIELLTPFMCSLYPLARLGRAVSDRMRRRRREAGRDQGSAVLDEIKVRPGLNGLMAALLRQEGRLLERGWTFPVGTSLLALARRPV